MTADGILDGRRHFDQQPTLVRIMPPSLPKAIPARIAGLWREAAICRRSGLFEAAGAIFRKTIDVATKHLFNVDPRLESKQPAVALRSRIKALGEMGIIDEEMVQLADIAALDGNDAAHDEDPYSSEEAEALEDLTFDLLDRLFVRPDRIARVRAKQVAAGQRQE
ncbi:DUF4145 domain-containing protein [Nitratireductor sp. StC3]|uniref:DUF4145 domain-containing protein n=1 Tax=Nitratireductor sp. StC3 TaxID=2126741 RepID=UPI001304CA0B|nr:DUF4145 domain-containing protein [Nitratireductor sp. StC3]